MARTMQLVEMDSLAQAAECLKLMAHPVRLRMVDILMQGELPVGQIAELCEVSPAQACEHLRMMQAHGFLSAERRGREVFYRIASPRLPKLMNCIRQTCEL